MPQGNNNDGLDRYRIGSDLPIIPKDIKRECDRLKMIVGLSQDPNIIRFLGDLKEKNLTLSDLMAK